MCGRGRGKDNGEKKRIRQQEDGFEVWGGYMAAKRAKLLKQFHSGPVEKESDIFFGVKIMINGLTHPPASELKDLMAKHGGEWHMYQTTATTHIIASNLPNTKIKHLGAIPIVKPAWIMESIALGKLLDYKRYLLYTNQSSKQPALNFPVINKNNVGPVSTKVGNSHLATQDKDFEIDEDSVSCLPSFSGIDNNSTDSTPTKIEILPVINGNNDSPVEEDVVKNNKNLSEIVVDSDADLFDDDMDLGIRNITDNKIDTHDYFKSFKKAEEIPEKNMGVTKICDISESATNRNMSTPVQIKVSKTASDPHFLEEFYNNSRLHLISTLGAEFKQLVGQLRDKSDGKFPGREKLKLEKGNVSFRPPPQSIVMHIDMDCFFVSVGLRSHPELRGKPVAITHARSGTISTADPVKEAEKQANRIKEFEMYTERLPIGAPSRVVDIKDKIDGLASMSEIASCSYEARKCGVKNGMFMGQAIKLCPDLKTLPYDFEGYREVSNALYKTVASYTLDIEAVSCDEMYVDVKPILTETGLTVEDWASHIRKEIMEVTGCPCSTGFGGNRLQARLATRKAKPAGQYFLQPEDVENYMSSISLEDLPGVGRATLFKLRTLGLSTCGDVQGASLKLLRSELGNKLGEKIKEQSFGRDNNPLNFHHERKSVSAEVNYGIRFKTKEECYNFIQSLSNEVFSRLSDINMKSRCLTLKLLVRAEGAPVETAKFLGHGVCDALSRSTTSNQILADANAIFREAKSLYDKLNAPFAELRGVGIQLTKLERSAPVNNALSNFLKQGAVKKTAQSQHKETTSKTRENVSTERMIGIERSPQTKLTDFIPQVNVNKSPSIIKFTEIDCNKRTAKNFENPIGIKGKKILQPNGKTSTNTTSIHSKGRGRPKDSKNSKNTAKSTKSVVKSAGKNLTMMQSFLGLKKKEQNLFHPQQKGEIAQPVEKIDMEVFNQLPPDIREEVMREYNFKPLRKLNQSGGEHSRTIGNTVNIVATTSKNVVKNEEKVRKKTREKIPKSSPFQHLSWEEIKPIIKVWIGSELEPNCKDVEMLGKHFRQLALDRKIEVLQSIFNFMHRVFTALDCPWHKAYFTFVNMMQTGMVEQYGLVLLVSTEFQCCHIQ